MATYWSKADESVIRMAQEVIDEFHPDLEEARIGFLFRDPPQFSQGRMVLGKAKKDSAQDQALLPLDIIIWVAYDYWGKAMPEQRRALIDHELCHCRYDSEEEKASMVGHDVEEFLEVIERYGMWRPALMRLEQTVRQLELPIEKPDAAEGGRGELVAVDPEKVKAW